MNFIVENQAEGPGAFLSTEDYSLHILKKGKSLEGDRFIKIPMLLVPALIPVMALLFVMFVPGLAFFGPLFFCLRF